MSILDLFRRRKPRPEAGLYESILEDSRQVILFGDGRFADDADGRFEALALHFTFVYRRLNALDANFAQGLFDRFVDDMDANLRELGVGDSRFGKRMKHMVASLYGRIQSYSDALETKNANALAEALTRNAEDAVSEKFILALTKYAIIADEKTQALTLEAFLAGETAAPRFTEQ